MNIVAASQAVRSTSRHASRIPSLDGIRALSFLLVFGGHAGLGNRLPIPGADFGVTIFFFLSGFIITTLMRSEFEATGSLNIRHFWLRRALRILPPLFLVVIGATVLALIIYPPGTVYVPAMTAEILFYANYWGIYGINREAPGTGVVWSLAVEEHFYLLFPLLYVAMQRWRMSRQHQALLLWGLCAVILAWRCVLVMAMHASIVHIYLATDTRADSILFGCALAVWNNPALDESPRVLRRWTYLLLPASLVVLVACLAYQGTLFRETVYFTLQGVALTTVFICAVRLPRWAVFRFLNYRPVIFVGTLSYSLYLVHQVLLRAARQLWPTYHAWQQALIALAASVTAAWAIYTLVERPCARLRNKLEHVPSLS